jgi:hypothetical protein
MHLTCVLTNGPDSSLKSLSPRKTSVFNRMAQCFVVGKSNRLGLLGREACGLVFQN